MVISIVIPLYNKEKAIVQTIQSVLNQSYSDFEIVIVDDGSTDNSASVVESFNDTRIKLIRKENGGVCSARNRGIIEAKGELVALLDADDLWDKDYLKEQVQMIEDFPEASMWGINFAEMSDGKLVRKLATGLPDGFRGYVEDYYGLKGRISDLFSSSSVVIRKDVFDKVGMFDERIKYAEDNDMWWRVIATHRVAFFDKYMVYYLFDAENRALNKPRLLKYFLPYYPEKFMESIFKSNAFFYKWIMCWCAQHIKKYYFGDDKSQFVDAVNAAKKLDYSVIPGKYRLLFRLPLPIAKIMYAFDEKRLSIKNQ